MSEENSRLIKIIVLGAVLVVGVVGWRYMADRPVSPKEPRERAAKIIRDLKTEVRAEFAAEEAELRERIEADEFGEDPRENVEYQRLSDAIHAKIDAAILDRIKSLPADKLELITSQFPELLKNSELP